MNRLLRWHLLERFWEPVRRQLFLARQLRTERDYWKKCAEKAERHLDHFYPQPDEKCFEVTPPLKTADKCGYDGCPGGSECPGHNSVEPPPATPATIDKGIGPSPFKRGAERLQSGAQVQPPPTEGPSLDAPSEED